MADVFFILYVAGVLVLATIYAVNMSKFFANMAD